MHRSKWWRLMALLSLVALLGAACGDDDDTGTVGDGGDGDLSSAPGFDGTTIKLGVITPLSGPVAIIGEPLTNGQRVFVEGLNARGGIAGQYPVELVEGDSQYDAATAAQQYSSISSDVVMFAQILGTPVVTALLQSLQEDNIVAQPASLDAEWIREQQLLPVGAPYQVQAANALDWWINQEGNADSVICWAGHDDQYGDAGLEGVEAAAAELDFEIAAEVRFSAADATPEAHAPNVGRLAGAGCEFVFLTATPSTAGAILGASAGASFAPTWVGNSPTWVNALATSPLAPYLAANFRLMTDGGEWGDESLPLMAQMLADIEAYSPDQAPDIYFTFGYAAMNAVTQVLEAAVENGDLSREGIVEAMNGLDVIEFGDVFGDYGWGTPEERVPPRISRVFVVDPEAAASGYLTPVTEQFASATAEALEFPAA